MLDTEAHLDFRIPPQAHLVRVVRDGVVEFARAHGVNEDDLAHFVAALGEALANAVEHARTSRAVTVECRIGRDRIVGTVQDEGVGFAATLPMSSELPDFASERGRGFPIMRRCTDIFALNTSPGKGTAVLVGRYLRELGMERVRA